MAPGVGPRCCRTGGSLGFQFDLTGDSRRSPAHFTPRSYVADDDESVPVSVGHQLADQLVSSGLGPIVYSPGFWSSLRSRASRAPFFFFGRRQPEASTPKLLQRAFAHHSVQTLPQATTIAGLETKDTGEVFDLHLRLSGLVEGFQNLFLGEVHGQGQFRLRSLAMVASQAFRFSFFLPQRCTVIPQNLETNKLQGGLRVPPMGPGQLTKPEIKQFAAFSLANPPVSK